MRRLERQVGRFRRVRLRYMSQLFEAGKVKPVIDSLRTLNEIPEAMRHFGSGNHKGKVVIALE
jgi:D-arabinose 1-dehydrogenase-like Zn-dependent alcohol dehydrogenase